MFGVLLVFEWLVSCDEYIFTGMLMGTEDEDFEF